MPVPEHDEAVAQAAEAIGELMAFWGFKRSMGVLWTVLYLHRRPMTQEDLASSSGISMGMVSMTLAELEGWGVVHRQRVPRDRRRFYVAETDVRGMITRVLQQRELLKVRAAIQDLRQASGVLRAPPAAASGAEKAESILMAQRMDGLVELAELGEGLVERMVRFGQLDLGALPDLARRRG
ncbi:MAG: MarR family transcriptional regulator [Pseudomonadota bacterium]